MQEINILVFQRLKPRQAVLCPWEGCLKTHEDCKACRYLIGVEYDGVVYCSFKPLDQQPRSKQPTVLDNIGSFL